MPQQHPSLRVMSLNVWGVPFIGAFTDERIDAILRALAQPENEVDVLGLQECFSLSVVTKLRIGLPAVGLPHIAFFSSGVGLPGRADGCGCLIASRFPISDVAFHAYSVGGRSYAINELDWHAGKGVGLARIVLPHGAGVADCYVSHLQAQYAEDPDPNEHQRILQSIEAGLFIRSTRRSDVVLLFVDLNSKPDTLVYRSLAGIGGLRDAYSGWHASSSRGSRGSSGGTTPSVGDDESPNSGTLTEARSLATAVSAVAAVAGTEAVRSIFDATFGMPDNTFSKRSHSHKKSVATALAAAAAASKKSGSTQPRAARAGNARLDYILFGTSNDFDPLGQSVYPSGRRHWHVLHSDIRMKEQVSVGRSGRKVNMSDHSAVYAELVCVPQPTVSRAVSSSSRGEPRHSTNHWASNGGTSSDNSGGSQTPPPASLLISPVSGFGSGGGGGRAQQRCTSPTFVFGAVPQDVTSEEEDCTGTHAAAAAGATTHVLDVWGDRHRRRGSRSQDPRNTSAAVTAASSSHGSDVVIDGAGGGVHALGGGLSFSPRPTVVAPVLPALHGLLHAGPGAGGSVPSFIGAAHSVVSADHSPGSASCGRVRSRSSPQYDALHARHVRAASMMEKAGQGDSTCNDSSSSSSPDRWHVSPPPLKRRSNSNAEQVVFAAAAAGGVQKRSWLLGLGSTSSSLPASSRAPSITMPFIGTTSDVLEMTRGRVPATRSAAGTAARGDYHVSPLDKLHSDGFLVPDGPHHTHNLAPHHPATDGSTIRKSISSASQQQRAHPQAQGRPPWPSAVHDADELLRECLNAVHEGALEASQSTQWHLRAAFVCFALAAALTYACFVGGATAPALAAGSTDAAFWGGCVALAVVSILRISRFPLLVVVLVACGGAAVASSLLVLYRVGALALLVAAGTALFPLGLLLLWIACFETEKDVRGYVRTAAALVVLLQRPRYLA